MTFDVTIFPVDRPLTYVEAIVEIDRVTGWRLGLGHDARLDPFLAEIERRYPGIRAPRRGDPPVEVTVTRGTVVIAVGWSRVGELVPAICDAAYQTGLAVWDPQRKTVGLPAPYADAPLGPVGLGPQVDTANQMIGAVVTSMNGGGVGEEGTTLGLSDQLRSIGATTMSPLGFEITPDIEDEVYADPTRYPRSLQTPERREELIASLADPFSGERHRALAGLSAWDPDPAVAAALRPILASEDVYEAGQAAQGLARQGDITDLPAVMDLGHRMSPADGGTVAAMLRPVMAALSLASLAGPDAVAGVKGRVASWRGAASGRRGQVDADAELDRLLAMDGGWR
jgi:hypothetical protein